MLEWKIVSDTTSTTLYQKGTRDCMINAFFDKENKTVDVWINEWVSNGTPRLEPMSEFVKYSAKYGYTQRTCPTLSMEDIEFLYKKRKELLGGGVNE